MGYPASAALLFKALTNEDDRWLHQDAMNMLSQFSLFAIILADPIKDPVFYQQLQHDFPFYDRLTGGNFMFFSIIKDADKDSFNGAHKRFKIFNDVDAYKQNHAAEETIHPGLAIHAICAILGVNYDETPCLIISDNLKFGRFCKISTGVNELEKQLIALRNVADNLSSRGASTSLANILEAYNDQINFFQSIESLNIDKIGLKIISEVLQVISKEGLFSEKTLERLQKNIDFKKLATYNPELIERLSEAISLLSGLNKSLVWDLPPLFKPTMVTDTDVAFVNNNANQNVINIPLKLYKEWLNVQASTKNHLECAAHMEKNMMHLFNATGDYSLLAFPLCKSFEIEIAFSAVQLIRKHLGVNMPQYFSKYCPAVNNLPIRPLESLVNNPREIYFNNKRNDGKWIPPPMGESRLGFATLKSRTIDFANEWQSPEKVKTLLDNWETIQKIRNKSAHMEQVSAKDKARLEESLKELHSANLLNGLTNLKLSLKN